MRKGYRSNGESFIQIESAEGNETILVSFETNKEFERWVEVFINSQKSEEDLLREKLT